ncbi:LysR family transcriptional regulator [Cupriavidus necator]|jgi:DNA-binding transcriptional LysR family regulator|uniref:LysR substrate-binding domain-containing protein n=1 Tax=Cupriavidus TaxID=106589 RepID=UPI00032E4E75|nr:MULTISPECIES: LysR substrate-binding domain-containing protein [Cupriavidus]EON18215.1 LysR family transcriptional regulator [Cupriavidus sp. GA3-3]KUE86300.1 LysR family transcriptional regulator [Cupriavidus necator]
MARQTASAPSAVLAKLRFRHLQLLDVLGRSRNLRIAAEQLHITQPAATKILSDIEDTLQARLFDRLPRDMRPTELGEFALRYASTALAELGKFVSELEALRAGGHGHLTVGAISASAAQVVTTAIREILQQRPRLVVKLIEQSSDQLAVWLEDRKLDIMVGRLTEPRHQAIFDFEALSPEPVWVVCRPGHPLLDRPRLEIADIGAWPWILYPQLTAIRQLFDETIAAAGIQGLVGMVETPSIFSTLELLQATDMLSLQPRAVVERFVAEGMLAHVPVPIRRAMSSYGIVTRKNELPSEAMLQFMAALRAAAR